MESHYRPEVFLVIRRHNESSRGWNKGHNFYKVVISPSRCTGALGQKQFHLEPRLCFYASWRVSTKRSFMCGFTSLDIILAENYCVLSIISSVFLRQNKVITFELNVCPCFVSVLFLKVLAEHTLQYSTSICIVVDVVVCSDIYIVGSLSSSAWIMLYLVIYIVAFCLRWINSLCYSIFLCILTAGV